MNYEFKSTASKKRTWLIKGRYTFTMSATDLSNTPTIIEKNYEGVIESCKSLKQADKWLKDLRKKYDNVTFSDLYIVCSAFYSEPFESWGIEHFNNCMEFDLAIEKLISDLYLHQDNLALSQLQQVNALYNAYKYSVLCTGDKVIIGTLNLNHIYTIKSITPTEIEVEEIDNQTFILEDVAIVNTPPITEKEVDFELLSQMTDNPTKEELNNYKLFLKYMTKKKFAKKASKLLRKYS